MSAIALTSAFGLASCSSTEDDGNINPTFDGQSVKTQFAINIPRAAGNNGTRATAAQTQGETNSPFLGINTVYLLPFTQNNVTSATSGSPIELTAILASEQRKIYRDVTIPIATKQFLFYGLAPQKDNNSFATGAFNEELSFIQETSPSSISFTLKPIINSPISYTSGVPNNLLTVLNNVNRLTWGDATMQEQFQQLNAGSANSIKQELQKVYDQVFKSSTDEEAFKNALGSTFTISEEGKIETTETFPRDLNLPDGIVKLKFTPRGGFSYEESNNTALGDMKIDPSSVAYPAPLAYYANTDIRTNDSEEATFPEANSWDEPNSWSGWNENAGVSSSTYAIALKEKINYGVGNLKLTVKCNNNSIEDNSGSTITIPSDGFKVTGLLIGGQPDKVGYDFQPTSTYTKTIFDNFEQSPLYAKGSDATTANYTLVLPSEKEAKVNFALELENNGDEFVGYDGVIPAGGKFYLIGTLDPETATEIPTNVTNPSIFMSDFQTKVNLNINSLAKAYNCIPDIRNTEQQLGLSVDLEWQKGYNFNVNIGDND